MAASGSTRLSEAKTPSRSQVNDDDIIKKQLQADIDSQAESYPTASRMKANKRKSRDMDEGVADDADERPRKKKTEGKQTKRKEKEPSECLHDGGLDVTHESSSHGANFSRKAPTGVQQAEEPPLRPAEASSQDLSELYGTEPNRKQKRKMARDKARRDSDLAVVSSRSSLGSNRDALLKSILKGCSPHKLNDVKVESSLRSESDSGDVSAVPNTFSTMRASPRAKSRPRVSMIPTLPEGYKPALTGSKGRFHCPVESCDKRYTRKTTLGEHMNTLHAGQILNDNKDGTMSIVSPEDYQTAINSGNDQNFIEIPNIPLHSKSIKAAHPAVNGKKEKKTLSTNEALHGVAVNAHAAYTRERNGSKMSKTREKSSTTEKTPPTIKATASKVQTETDSSEYEPSVIHDRRRSSRESTLKSPTVNPAKPRGFLDSAVKSPTNKTPPPKVSTSSRSSSVNGIHPDTSENEIEGWEIEPGVIAGSSSGRGDDSETEHSTAYSSVYINSAEAGIKLSGVHFQVIRIAPGSNAPGPIIPYQRVCSVAAGKVQVKVGGNQFSIGAHGMWRIQAGEKCTVGNRYYSEAVIHVSTINAD